MNSYAYIVMSLIYVMRNLDSFICVMNSKCKVLFLVCTNVQENAIDLKRKSGTSSDYLKADDSFHMQVLYRPTHTRT